MAYFLIGFGIGSLMVSGINYAEQTHEEFLPTKYVLATGILTLCAGLVWAFI